MNGAAGTSRLRRTGTRVLKSGRAFLCAVVVCPLLGSVAEAFVLVEDQAMSFGRFIVLDNAATRSVTMDTSGNISSTGDILVYKDAQPGAFSITGANPLASHTITVTPDPFDLTIVNNRYFSIDTFTISNSTSDADGNLSFTIGATIHTDGDGTYNEAVYTGSYTVTVTDP